jgi:hypothetical protein
VTDAYNTAMWQRESYIGSVENNDCTVVALSIALSLPYGVAHAILARYGRRNGKGFQLIQWLRQYGKVNLYGFKATVVDCTPFECGRARIYPTLAKVRRDFPRGRFIVRKPGHVFAMIDGVVHDSAGQRTRITSIVAFERC